MPIDLKRYQVLKSKVDDLQRDADRAEGALTQLMERLKTEHDCDTLEQAEKKVAKLKKALAAAEQQYESDLEEFETDWEHVLKENER